MDAAAEKEYVPPPLSVQQEGTQRTSVHGLHTWTDVCFPDAIIHTRITNDEKALRRVTKKFHSYTSVAYTPAVPLSPLASSSVRPTPAISGCV